MSLASPPRASDAPEGRGIRRRGLSGEALREHLVRMVCFAAASVSVLTTFGIILILAGESFQFFQKVSPVEFFTGREWAPLFRPQKFGILPLAAGTFLVTFWAGIFALPIGLLAAIYLSEYASPRARNILKPALEVLAGIPTVVYGFFGLFFVTPLLRQFFPGVQVFNAASGAIVVGIMILPLVSSLCEDALSAVPRSLREGAYALGATKMEATTRIVVPAALSGISAAYILAISRAVGETMAVTLAAGATPRMTLNPAESIQTMTAYIVQVSLGDTPFGTTAYQTIFAVGMTLFIITLLLNMLALRLVKRFRYVYE